MYFIILNVHEILTTIIILVCTYNYYHHSGNVDYDPGPYEVTFPAEMITVSFDVSITDDSMFEGNETFTVNILPSTLPSRVVQRAGCVVAVTIDDEDSKYSNI